MAKKTFSEVNGVRYDLVREKNKLGIGYNDKRTITSEGDNIYAIDIDNNFEIVNAICKKIYHYYRSRCEVWYCLESEAEKFKNYCPGGSYNEKIPNGMRLATGKSNRTHNGLLFTDLDEAKEYQAKMREGKTFFQLKAGDTVYAVGGDATELKKLVVSKTETREEYDKEYFFIFFKGGGNVRMRHLRYEDKACNLLDYDMYFSDIKGLNRWGNGNTYFFVNENDAAKLLSDRAKRQKKNATDKYIKKMENYDGKPIKHHDSNDNTLHYGDKVAYAVSGGSSSPFISLGKIVGETEQKITVEDVAKKDEPNHNVSPYSVILVEAAKTNVNSGFILNK